jgi:hypothetical protein
MKRNMFNYGRLTFLITVLIFIGDGLLAQNPLIRDQFTADPSARVYGDRVYIYPSHDILANAQRGRIGWFCMEDYHVFSSSNLTDWKDHGVIVSQNKVPWVKPDSYSMWAPDCIERNGKYYFYFPSTPKDSTIAKGFTIGVAVANQPTGPFIPQEKPILGVKGIDPNVFIDKDGQAYLYWSQGNIYAAKLKDNMLELASDPEILHDLPSKGLKEGPYMFEREGKYYLTYPHVENKTERLEYAIGDHPLGPFTFAGVIIDESPNCWTNHHSILNFKNQWYLFYHFNDYSPEFDKARSIRADSLFFNPDGNIRKVNPTLRGVGITKANDKIQLDRYSFICGNGADIDFLDTTNKFGGWQLRLSDKKTSVQYNSVDFEKGKAKKAVVRGRSGKGGILNIRINNSKGPVLTSVKIPPGTSWSNLYASLSVSASGIQNLVVSLDEGDELEVDWVSFE